MNNIPSDELVCALAANQLQQISLTQKKILLDHFHSFQKIFLAKKDNLLEIPNLDSTTMGHLLRFSNFDRAYAEFKKIEAEKIEVLTYLDSKYPQSLREIYDPPPLLYALGDTRLLGTISLAVVGSRKASFYGLSSTSHLVKNLSHEGLTIVSGGARGIDTQAHKTTLENKGKTIVVLGCGLDVAYPEENKNLFQEVAKEGCLISEFSLGTAPFQFNFPQRNRIISGLSHGVLVVEAAKRSGSLITARFALEQGKDVFAVPGSILSSHYEGTNQLIQDGAILTQQASDILWHLGIDKKKESSYTENTLFPRETFSEEERKVFNVLSHEIQTADEIERVTNMSLQTIQESLTHMQLEGYIKEVAGKRFVRNEEVAR